MFIRQSRQHYMPDIQRQTGTDSETDKYNNTDNNTVIIYFRLHNRVRK